MEVEIKLRLPSADAHQLLADSLPRSSHLATHLQENLFLDTPSGRLALSRSALRLRFYGPADARCVLSLKSRPTLSSGVSRVLELEEDLDPSLGRAVVASPTTVLSLDSSEIVRRVKVEIGAEGEEEGFVCLGGFKNVRMVYGWEEGLVLELDETEYGFGRCYEVECETSEPERAKEMLEGFLKEKGIPYSYSEASKFAVFRAGRLLP
ncbi:triphosphate tunel metalloenzyme 3 [Iris pallida]|uniref:Triphosphate tunel metalloenzyme 3 n=1 Tax=Iris pallida TaxID=29817 RepID=A0AAX6H158_IRIPA|nr:triphosphate tunel metalloenzyme 3 [Iris pallida]KAJ6834215.1 triphosphate tunel metalloenzyme 3 [Iris pallida]